MNDSPFSVSAQAVRFTESYLSRKFKARLSQSPDALTSALSRKYTMYACVLSSFARFQTIIIIGVDCVVY